MGTGLLTSILLPPGHNAGDLVESYKWEVMKEAPGEFQVKAHLPERLLNPRKQLFGGFHGVYCLLYTSPSPRDKRQYRMPSSA